MTGGAPTDRTGPTGPDAATEGTGAAARDAARARSGTAGRSGAFDVLDPSSLAEPRGWSHGLLAPAGGRVLFVAGQTARDAEGRIVDGGLVEQFAAALRNVLAVVREAGGGPRSLGCLTIYVTDLDAYRASLGPLGEAYRSLMSRHYPAMALVEVSGLVDADAVVEIEATAVIGAPGHGPASAPGPREARDPGSEEPRDDEPPARGPDAHPDEASR